MPEHKCGHIEQKIINCTNVTEFKQYWGVRLENQTKMRGKKRDRGTEPSLEVTRQ
jgi:hypothetical protein